MKNLWTIAVQSEENERIAMTYGDPADALTAVENYALYPLPESITNWHAITPLFETDHWYDITAFYSRRKAGLTKEDSELLFEFNQRAFDATKEKGGLVLYYQGVLIGNDNKQTYQGLELSFTPNCLSFCIWNTLQEAKAGAKIDEHKQAVRMISRWYDGFAIKKYQVMLKQDAKTNKLIFQETSFIQSH